MGDRRLRAGAFIKYRGQTVGTFGKAATFPFTRKNPGLWGMQGAIVTSDQELAESMAMFARHGGIRKGDHQIEGINRVASTDFWASHPVS